MPRRRKIRGDGVVGDVVQRIKDIWTGVRKVASPAIRKFTEKNGDAKITGITVCRQPVTPGVEKVANWLSLGKYEANKRSLQYDKMLHLFMIITLDNGKTVKFEKNHLPELSYSVNTGDDFVIAPRPNGITWRDMIAEAEKKAGGSEKLWVYDAITQNCQYFVQAVLKACGSWNEELRKFVMQDAAATIEGMSWFQSLARKLTDTSNVIDVAMNGQGGGGHFLIHPYYNYVNVGMSGAGMHVPGIFPGEEKKESVLRI